MNWEDFPPLSTQPIGVQPDGTVVELHPITLPGQLVTLAGGEPPTVSMGAGVTVSANEILSHLGAVVFVPFQNDAGAVLIESDGETTEAPEDGTAYPLTLG